MNKGPERIARDIKGRLLPEYEEQLKMVLARIESANKYYADKMNQIFKLADFLGMVRPSDDSRTTLYPDHKRGVYSIESYSDKAVKFTVEVDADKAIEVLKILGYGK
jgi:hypothetical protein